MIMVLWLEFLSVDDVLDLLAEQMMDLAKLISKEQYQEQAKTV